MHRIIFMRRFALEITKKYSNKPRIMKKKILLDAIREKRKKYGKDSKETLKAIYNLVKAYPYYDGYIEDWLNKNGHDLK